MNLIPSFQSIMSISPEIRDQAYQFFIEEVPELLQMLESGLLTLRQERSTAKVHELMRAAHSLKGGAASVDLHAIKTIAHRLEDIFKALYTDSVVLDTTLESLLLEAYDCLRLPLMEQMTLGDSDPELALEKAEPIFTQLEAQLGDAIAQAETFIPSSSDLGIDMIFSIFDVDVGQGLERLQVVLANPQDYEVAGELRAQAEVFKGFAELLDLPGFGATAEAALKGLDTHPDEAMLITQLALADFQTARDAVLAGERSQVGGPSVELVALGDPTAAAIFDQASTPTIEPINTEFDWEKVEPVSADSIPLIEDIVGDSEPLTESCEDLSPSSDIEVSADVAIADQLEGVEDIPEVFPQTEIPLDSSADFTLEAANSKLDEIFGDSAAESEADTAYAAYEASEIGATEGITDYVDIVIPDNSAIDEGCEAGEQLILDVSEDGDPLQALDGERLQTERGSAASTSETAALITSCEEELSANSIPLIEDIFGDSEPLTESCEDLSPLSVEVEVPADQAIADQLEGIENNPEVLPQKEFPLDSSSDFTLETANSKLDEIFGDLAAASEADAVYEAYKSSEIEATEGITDYVDIVIPANSAIDAESESVEQLSLETTEGITDYIDIVIPTNSAIDAGSEPAEPNSLDILNESAITDHVENPAPTQHLTSQGQAESPETLAEAVCSVEQIFESLPSVETTATLISEEAALPINGLLPTPREAATAVNPLAALIPSPSQGALIRQGDKANQTPLEQEISDTRQHKQPKLSVRVDLDRLGRMDNLLGELAINRNGLSLQNEQLQRSVRELLYRFAHFQHLTGFLQDLSDQMLIVPERHLARQPLTPKTDSPGGTHLTSLASANFDSLELDNYSALHGLLQELLEEVIQLEESVGDIELFAGQSNQMLEQQRQRMTQLRNELMWARMLPLSGVLNRFPRMLRDLSANYHKPVNLKISGAGVLVDKAVLEKLYTPLLHLLRNAFDHGIEDPETRLRQGKSEQGQIEIRAYHQGNTTVIEVRDDGQGLDLGKIGRRAVELGLLSADQLTVADKKQLTELIFSPGFSTAPQVSELSGRGVGLDAVRSQLRSLKGTLSVTPFPGQGTTFTLRLPLTLTVAKLLISFIGSTALAIPSDSIEEIVIPKAGQIKQSGNQRLLYWQNQLVPVYPMAELQDHAYPQPETLPSKALSSVPSPRNWALPMLIMRQDQTIFALEIERLVTEQELVIKPFGAVIASPSYTYGCTILGDGSLVPVIDGAALVEYVMGQSSTATLTTAPEADLPITRSADSEPIAAGGMGQTMQPLPPSQTLTILVVDDSAALRRTLALTLQRAGYRVLQARDGQEALDQLQQNSIVKLIICDIEMPNMNGFEFLHQRRQAPQISRIPVAMLTSRGNPKHRRLAMHLGANQYFTKPYIEQAFLVEIRNMLEQQKSEAVPVLT